MVAADLIDAAGRTAYLAGFHAAQAFIFERTSKVAKTHRGVRAEFVRLARDEPAIGPDDRSFLGRAYNLKTIADYETGPFSRVAASQAAVAITGAKSLVGSVTKLLEDSAA